MRWVIQERSFNTGPSMVSIPKGSLLLGVNQNQGYINLRYLAPEGSTETDTVHLQTIPIWGSFEHTNDPIHLGTINNLNGVDYEVFRVFP